MKAFVIWIDREHAKILEMSAEKMERTEIRPGHPLHHSHPVDGLDHERWEKKLFLQAVQTMKDADKLLILGPGVAKHHFRNYLSEQHPFLARKVVGCETVDHPTNGEIAALARRFFDVQEAQRVKSTG